MQPKAFYPLVLDDGGRNLSRRPGQHSDCVVRAFAIVTGLPYDNVYDSFARFGRKPCDGFDSTAWLKRRGGAAFGGRFKSIELRAPNHRILPTPLFFHMIYPKGRFLLEIENHVWAVIDGIHHDLWRVKEQPLTGIWQWFPGKKTLDILTGIG